MKGSNNIQSKIPPKTRYMQEWWSRFSDRYHETYNACIGRWKKQIIRWKPNTPIYSIPPFSCSIFREETVNALRANLPMVMAQQRFFAAGIAVADTPHTATGVIYAQIGNVTWPKPKHQQTRWARGKSGRSNFCIHLSHPLKLLSFHPKSYLTFLKLELQARDFIHTH